MLWISVLCTRNQEHCQHGYWVELFPISFHHWFIRNTVHHIIWILKYNNLVECATEPCMAVYLNGHTTFVLDSALWELAWQDQWLLDAKEISNRHEALQTVLECIPAACGKGEWHGQPVANALTSWLQSAASHRVRAPSSVHTQRAKPNEMILY